MPSVGCWRRSTAGFVAFGFAAHDIGETAKASATRQHQVRAAPQKRRCFIKAALKGKYLTLTEREFLCPASKLPAFCRHSYLFALFDKQGHLDLKAGFEPGNFRHAAAR
jgi:hypothetical protein